MRGIWQIVIFKFLEYLKTPRQTLKDGSVEYLDSIDVDGIEPLGNTSLR